MRLRTPGFVHFLGCLLFALPLHAEIEFVGVLKTSDKTLIALTDTTTTKTEWIGIGQTFAGHTLKAHHVSPDAVTLVKGGAELRVPLKDDAKIKAARLELAGTIAMGLGERIQISRVTLLYDQENVFPLKDGLTYRITPQRRPDGTILFRASIERRVSENTRETLSAPAVVTLAGTPFRIQVGELQFAFTPLGP